MSLRWKILLTTLSMAALAVGTILISIRFATITEADAAAINEAGSLRMQSWRIAEHVVVPELVTEDILAPLVQLYDSSLEQQALTILAEWDSPIADQYQAIRQEWRGRMRARLERGDFAGYISAVPGYVDRIDAMVDALQNNTERKLQGLYSTMVAALVCLALITLLILRDLRRSLLMPVSALVQATHKVQRQDFDLQLGYTPDNELGQLTRAFTHMATDLHSLYSHLEQEVARQTRALSHSNGALKLLYQCSRQLSHNPYDKGQLTSLLQQWQSLLNLEGCYLCLSSTTEPNLLQRIEHGTSQSQPCRGDHCPSCQNPCQSDCSDAGDNRHIWQLTVAGSGNDQPFGFLRIIVGADQPLSDEDKQWLKIFVEVLATSLNNHRRRKHERQLLLMNERTVIARELHDSLAQAMSYQKIQIARLKRLLPEDQPGSQMPREIVDDLQQGISSAYRQLRELLVTFRLSMAEGSLQDNIARTLDEFRQRAPQIEFSLNDQVRFQSVGAHQEIHILQIIREALNNVVQHAQAEQCRVSCVPAGEQRVSISVDDNGSGLPANPEHHGHYGLTIMRERAASLEGEVTLLPSELGGTRVQLIFRTVSAENTIDDLECTVN